MLTAAETRPMPEYFHHSSTRSRKLQNSTVENFYLLSEIHVSIMTRWHHPGVSQSCKTRRIIFQSAGCPVLLKGAPCWQRSELARDNTFINRAIVSELSQKTKWSMFRKHFQPLFIFPWFSTNKHSVCHPGCFAPECIITFYYLHSYPSQPRPPPARLHRATHVRKLKSPDVSWEKTVMSPAEGNKHPATPAGSFLCLPNRKQQTKVIVQMTEWKTFQNDVLESFR